ncbi:MAG: 16S rRNA (guanine(527)-N(7))-methyltransferase RsmG [Halofilum sp. (in: g-proteobacteria)]|nr:16S rRNA (guanine(527)-N(7))-methyltransferase RsmG [Halofilum sp. (in: g-proteobacteria)]
MTDEVLAAGLAALGQELDPARQRQLLAYRDELARWGRVHNLTAVLEPERMVPTHLLDSLVLLPLLRGTTLADVGSGGGLPGLPLAIAAPGLDVTLIEPRTKRAAFLAHVARHLGLANVKVERCRAEDLPAGDGFDTVVTRAFGRLAAFAAAAGGLARPGGCLLAAKGRDPAAEIAELDPEWAVEVTRLSVPGIEGTRHAVRLQRDGERWRASSR